MPADGDYERAAEVADAIDRTSPGASESVDVEAVLAEGMSTRELSYQEVSRSLQKEGFYTEPVQEARQQVQVAVQAVRKPELEAEKKRAAFSLRKATVGLGAEFGRVMEERKEQAEEKRLIMPRLSLQDQVSDLGKIEEGLQERVFSSDQIAIIAEELRWLSGAEARVSSEEANQDQKVLLAIRSQKVREINGMLAGM
jgi:hypothetical protein